MSEHLSMEIQCKVLWTYKASEKTYDLLKKIYLRTSHIQKKVTKNKPVLKENPAHLSPLLPCFNHPSKSSH